MKHSTESRKAIADLIIPRHNGAIHYSLFADVLALSFSLSDANRDELKQMRTEVSHEMTSSIRC